MATTTRATRECSLNELNPALRDAMRAIATEHAMGDLETGILMCCETTSKSRKKGVFGGMEDSISAVFVTPTWLVWAESTNTNAAQIGAAKLRQIEVRDYESTAMYTVTPDMGLNVTGRYTSVQKTGITFIALDTGPAGKKFRQVLSEARKKVSS